MSEADYDEIIAPMLLEVAKKAEALGMSLICRVEWEPGESGITQIGNFGSSGQYLTRAAALSHGNIDAMLFHLLKHYDCSQSAILHKYNHITSPA